MFKTRTTLVVLAVLVVLVLAPLPASAAQSANFLTNGSFEDGSFKQDGVVELTVPNGWVLHYLEGGTFAGVPADQPPTGRPESVVWPYWEARADLQGYWLDGDYTVRLFKSWTPVYFGMSQDVSGLQVGETYEFIVPVFVDVYERIDGFTRFAPTNERDAVGIRLGTSGWGAEWRNPGQINYGGYVTADSVDPFYLSYVTLRHRFTATSSNMTVWLEMYSRYGYHNNGFILDNLQLVQTSGSPPPRINPTATPVPTSAGSTAPTATPAPASSNPAPTATPQPAPTTAPVVSYIDYTVQPGDRLYRIAQRYGVSMAEIAAANNISNWSLIFVGTTLRIPTYSAPPAAETPTSGGSPTTGGSTPSSYTIKPGDRLSNIAREFGVPYRILASTNNLVNPNLIYPGQVIIIPSDLRIHTVQVGDRLVNIAAQYGTTVAAIVSANDLTTGDVIYVGQELIIP